VANTGTDHAADAEWALAELLAGPDWRLTVTGQKDGRATAEVAHEVLLKSWPTLQRWLEEQRDFLIWRGELDVRRKEYDEAGKAGPRQQRQALLMGLPLDTARKHLAARLGDIEPADRAFVEASMRAERAATHTWRGVQAAVGVLMLGTIAGLLGILFRDDIGKAWFDYFTVRPYAAATFTPYVLPPEAELALRPADAFAECAAVSRACPQMVVVPSGAFTMGSPDVEGYLDEHPLHEVSIAAPFAVGRFELTWDEWEACVAMRGCDGRPTSDSSGFGKEGRPVINVSWDQAQDYVAWLSRMTGKEYRLLTEAEWEYAARGVLSVDAPHPTNPWDPADLCLHANLADRSFRNAGYAGDIADCDDGYATTAPVGSYPANAFGLHDMHGNVWEWVEDCYHPGYDGAPDDGSAWIEGNDCSRRMVRGGSCYNSILRSAARIRLITDYRLYDVGFRVARTLATP
jgi:formylglycine-generating enzyme required for sulfatase activity